MHVLRKGYEAHSAGTAVSWDDKYQEYYIFDTFIPAEFVVKRRERTAVVPVINSRARRKQVKLARAMVLGLASKDSDA